MSFSGAGAEFKAAMGNMFDGIVEGAKDTLQESGTRGKDIYNNMTTTVAGYVNGITHIIKDNGVDIYTKASVSTRGVYDKAKFATKDIGVMEYMIYCIFIMVAVVPVMRLIVKIISKKKNQENGWWNNLSYEDEKRVTSTHRNGYKVMACSHDGCNTRAKFGITRDTVPMTCIAHVGRVLSLGGDCVKSFGCRNFRCNKRVVNGTTFCRSCKDETGLITSAGN